MGKPDVSIKQWLKTKRRFADLFNGILFEGEQIIKAEELEEIDSESDIIIADKSHKTKALQRHRDIVMKWQGLKLIILAVENQLKVNYAMPVRNMLYDSLSYSDQIHNIWNSLSEAERKDICTDELFSGYRKGDRLSPVVTIVFYFGSDKEWDGALSLYDMFGDFYTERTKKVLNKYVPNYRINLLDVSNIKDINVFKSDLQIILGMLKYRKDADKLHNYVKEHLSYFQNIDSETCYAVEAFLNSDKRFKNAINKNRTKGGVNMCKALDDLYLRGVNEGEAKGEAEGKAKAKISLICRKILKNKPLEVIADELEEDIDTVKPIYDIAIQCSPDYNCEEIYKRLQAVEYV